MPPQQVFFFNPCFNQPPPPSPVSWMDRFLAHEIHTIYSDYKMECRYDDMMSKARIHKHKISYRAVLNGEMCSEGQREKVCELKVEIEVSM